MNIQARNRGRRGRTFSLSRLHSLRVRERRERERGKKKTKKTRRDDRGACHVEYDGGAATRTGAHGERQRSDTNLRRDKASEFEREGEGSLTRKRTSTQTREKNKKEGKACVGALLFSLVSCVYFSFFPSFFLPPAFSYLLVHPQSSSVEGRSKPRRSCPSCLVERKDQMTRESSAQR